MDIKIDLSLTWKYEIRKKKMLKTYILKMMLTVGKNNNINICIYIEIIQQSNITT